MQKEKPDQSKREYSLKSPQLSLNTGVAATSSQYVVAAPAVAPITAQQNVVPPIGPEIGPDPRSSTVHVSLPGHPALLGDNDVQFDFNYGYRLEAPNREGTFRLMVFDLDTHALIATHKLQARQLAIGVKKYFIRYRLELYEEKTGKLIFEHNYDCTNKKVMIVIPDGGLGDNLAWIPYVEAFKQKYNARVSCSCGEWMIRLLRDQYPLIDFIPADQAPSLKDFYASYFLAIFKEERKDWRPADHQHFGMQGSIALVLGLEPTPRKVRLPRPTPRKIAEPYVCISTMATNPAKYWNYPDGWNALCRYLKRLGYRVLVIDRDHDLNFAGKPYSVPSEAEDFTGFIPIRERMELLQNAEFFVGLPSGLSWLAWNCDIPVVMLSGFTLDGSEFPTPYRVVNLDFCHGCWNDSALFFDMSTPVWCPRHLGTAREIECTKAITPKMVFETIAKIPSVRRRIKPLVSFGVPVYNAPAEHLVPMLDSIIEVAEKYGCAEILLRDDASTLPETGEILREYQRRYPALISVAFDRNNIGICASRQELLERAKGKYFISFDQDDIMLPFNLDRVVAEMERNPKWLASYSRKYFFNESGLLQEIGAEPHSPFTAFFAMTQVSNATLFRTDAMLECDGYRNTPPEIGDDVGLFLHLSRLGVFHFDYREPRVLARKHAARSGAHFGNGTHEDYRRFTQKLIAKYADQYAAVMELKVPEGEPHVIAGLFGAACFLNQKDNDFCRKICALAYENFPDDYGLVKTFLQLLSPPAYKAQFSEVLAAGVKRFDEKLPELLHTLSVAGSSGRALIPGAEARFNALYAEGGKTPGQVLDALQKLFPHQPSQLPIAEVLPIKISVIICVFSARYIRPCVESVVRTFKSYGRTEILLYNDASFEADVAMTLNRLAAEYPDMVKVWHGEENQGVALGRAFLMRHAVGEYIVSFDHDDIMLPFDVAAAVEFMDTHLQYSVSYASKYLFSKESGYLNEIHGANFSYFTAFFGPRVNINAALLRHKRVIEAGGFRRVNGNKASGWDDIYLLTRMAQFGEFHFSAEPRCLYRIHSGQITSAKQPWDDWITTFICNEHKELYDRILAGDIPPVNAENFKIVRGLMGAAIFLHQRDRKITDPIMEVALRELADDPGVWDIYLTLLLIDKKYEKLRELAPTLPERFPQHPAFIADVLRKVLLSYQLEEQEPPGELAAQIARHSAQYLAPPKIVRAALSEV